MTKEELIESVYELPDMKNPDNKIIRQTIIGWIELAYNIGHQNGYNEGFDAGVKQTVQIQSMVNKTLFGS